MKFKKDFIFGGATAAYQCEGSTDKHGKGKISWDYFLKTKKNFSADPASDFYNKYPIDLKLCNMFGINGIRISISWSRIFPNGDDKINKEGVKFYHNLFKECHKYNVEPFVTLHHFDTPYTLFKNGDFLNRSTINSFVNYAKFCFEEFNDEVKYWFTFNEIWAIATNQYIEGTFPNAEKYNLTKAFQLMHNMMVAHAKTIIEYKKNGYNGKIGCIHSLEYKYPFDVNNQEDIIAAKNEDVLQNQFLLDATFKGYYSVETMNIVNKLLNLNNGSLDIKDEDLKILKLASEQNDYLGINYYQSRFIKSYTGKNDIFHNGTGEKGTSVFKLNGVGERKIKDDIPRTDWDWLIHPESMFDMLIRIKLQYPNYKTIYITENGMGYKDEFINGFIDDTPRINYIRQHLKYVLKAIELGVDVRGYFVWSLMDMFSWTNGYNKRYGLFYVDFETQKRYPKESAYWYKLISDTKELL